jgi:excisionase family DNA binding protein
MESRNVTKLDPAATPTISIEEAGRFLGIGRSCAYGCAKRGEIPTIRLGRRLVVPTAALLRLLEIGARQDVRESSSQNIIDEFDADGGDGDDMAPGRRAPRFGSWEGA